MSETKFTPGPWVLIEGEFDSEVEVTTDIRQENSKGNICGMDIYFDGSHGVEQPANAHLIASAPEMYEILEFISENPSETNVIAIRKILAKARGEK
jgi:hypothetical protein